MDPAVDALAFRYGAALAAPLLAWLAVAAAALGLWRIRAVASKSDASPPPPVTVPRPSPAPSVAARAERSPRGHGEGDGTPRGRFTAYFHGEDNGDERDEEEEEEEEERDGVSEVDGDAALVGGLVCYRGVRRRRRRRRGDVGWYRYQDRTALSGSVVRLWGEERSDGRITATSP